MKSKFVVLKPCEVDNALVPDELTGLDDVDHVRCMIHSSKFDMDNLPKLRLTADKDYPDDKLLIDCFANACSVIPVSKRVMDFLQDEVDEEIQYLPVEMLDHRGKVATTSYILHPLRLIDCLDYEASNARFSALGENMIHRMSKVVIRADEVPTDCQMFRLPKLQEFVLFERTLANKILDQGFTGISFRELEKCRL